MNQRCLPQFVNLGDNFGIHKVQKTSSDPIQIQLGYGILIISLSAIGQSVVFRIANGSADVISGNADYVTITRVGEYVISISSEHNLIAFSFGNDKG